MGNDGSRPANGDQQRSNHDKQESNIDNSGNHDKQNSNHDKSSSINDKSSSSINDKNIKLDEDRSIGSIHTNNTGASLQIQFSGSLSDGGDSNWDESSMTNSTTAWEDTGTFATYPNTTMPVSNVGQAPAASARVFPTNLSTIVQDVVLTDDQDANALGTTKNKLSQQTRNALQVPGIPSYLHPARALAQHHLSLTGMVLAMAEKRDDWKERLPIMANDFVQQSSIQRETTTDTETTSSSSSSTSMPFPADISNIWKAWVDRRQHHPLSFASDDTVVYKLEEDLASFEYAYAICYSPSLETMTVVLAAPNDGRLGQEFTDYKDWNGRTVGIDSHWTEQVLGYESLLECILQDVKQVSKYSLPADSNVQSVSFCGYGGGGALATIAGVYYATHYEPVGPTIQIWTFGAPRVGDTRWEDLHRDLEHKGRLTHVGFRTSHDARPFGSLDGWTMFRDNGHCETIRADGLLEYADWIQSWKMVAPLGKWYRQARHDKRQQQERRRKSILILVALVMVYVPLLWVFVYPPAGMFAFRDGTVVYDDSGKHVDAVVGVTKKDTDTGRVVFGAGVDRDGPDLEPTDTATVKATLLDTGVDAVPETVQEVVTSKEIPPETRQDAKVEREMNVVVPNVTQTIDETKKDNDHNNESRQGSSRKDQDDTDTPTVTNESPDVASGEESNESPADTTVVDAVVELESTNESTGDEETDSRDDVGEGVDENVTKDAGKDVDENVGEDVDDEKVDDSILERPKFGVTRPQDPRLHVAPADTVPDVSVSESDRGTVLDTVPVGIDANGSVEEGGSATSPDTDKEEAVEGQDEASPNKATEDVPAATESDNNHSNDDDLDGNKDSILPVNRETAEAETTHTTEDVPVPAESSSNNETTDGQESDTLTMDPTESTPSMETTMDEPLLEAPLSPLPPHKSIFSRATPLRPRTSVLPPDLAYMLLEERLQQHDMQDLFDGWGHKHFHAQNLAHHDAAEAARFVLEEAKSKGLDVGLE